MVNPTPEQMFGYPLWVVAVGWLTVIMILAWRKGFRDQSLRVWVRRGGILTLLIGATILAIFQQPKWALQLLGIDFLYELVPTDVTTLMTFTNALQIITSLCLVVSIILSLYLPFLSSADPLDEDPGGGDMEGKKNPNSTFNQKDVIEQLEAIPSFKHLFHRAIASNYVELKA